MKLLRYGPKGLEKPGVFDQTGAIRDLSGHVSDLGGQTVSISALDRLRALNVYSLPIVEEEHRLGAALIDAPNFLCIGLNYAKHAAESGMEPPSEPIVFSKATSALAGPFDPLILPKASSMTDWEVELGVVIGRDCSYVSEAQALDQVAAYCTINDFSEREFQLKRNGQWIKGKSAPGFGPVGPYLLTADEAPDPQNLGLSLKLNNETVQSSNTSDMIFSVAEIISYLSRFMKLRAGDIIATGTPSGVGAGMSPRRFLKPGDVVEPQVEKLGAQRTEILAHPDA